MIRDFIRRALIGCTVLAIVMLLAYIGHSAVSESQSAYEHTNTPGTIQLKNVHKGDWLRIVVRWTLGGQVIGLFTDNQRNPWYPSVLNSHGAPKNMEAFETIAQADGDLAVNTYLYIHADVFYDIRIDELSAK